MATNDILQRQIASMLMSQRPEQIAMSTIRLWEAVATELTPIIGEHGFTILYTRSIHLTQVTFPWLAVSQLPLPDELPFTLLKLSLDDRPVTEAAEASKTLFVTFTDILVVLIGESLTIGILRAAWNITVPEITTKEKENE